ncbi:peptidylprolyl isomerase [Ruegeria sp. TM1040]|jgi:peptidyl-prolyl cis-trans isomerase SurA|uniref:peptidylprolyl isomerase n=1 Tax=Rhodobacterales TaxID=204455 RepID=UPI00004626FD|nr:peptidylprolyl isomerase [Ruegeria sp. TM1040]ABF63679.1 PpiC-type peptidyl-prolyl cis-trans isomerase [Ruegeria sp. TM1040]MDF9302464.1 peptidylprolyl isomerase [Tritonibacter mobilis]
MQQNLTFRQISLALINWTRRASYAAGLALAIAAAAPADLQAQGLFSPAITVNEDVITTYELEQRALFLSVLGSVQGDPFETARDDLIEDRLKRQVMKDVGLTLSEEEVTEGMRELAQRANLTLEEFLASLNQAGVAPETVRDFTTAGLGWREYVRGRFLSQARPSEAEIDRAMGTAGSGSVQVLLSEIILPLTQENAAQVQDLAIQISELTRAEAFAASAAQFSAADSRTDGGRLPWMSLSRLPPQLQEVVLGLEPGEITQPLPMQGAIAIFRMRGLREVDGRSATYAAIDYATYRIPGGRSPEALARATEIRDEIDTCDDLYGINKGQDPDRLFRGSEAPGAIPQDIALELSRFDENESSATLTRDNGQTLLFVMLCGRTSEVVASQENARVAVANALVQQRLNELAEAHVEQLKANARIDFQ